MAEELAKPKKFEMGCYCCEYAFGVCRILCYMACCKCKHKEIPLKEEFSLLALGLSGAGKSTLLSKLCGEVEENIEPTKGFSIKDVSLTSAILHIKEVGGSEKIRRYWHHYYENVEGLIFVFDGSATDEETDIAKAELESALLHRSLSHSPLLVLVSKMDSESPDKLNQISEKLDIPKLCNSRSFIVDSYNLDDINHLKMLLEKFSDLIKRQDSNVEQEKNKNDEPMQGRL